MGARELSIAEIQMGGNQAFMVSKFDGGTYRVSGEPLLETDNGIKYTDFRKG